MVNLFLQITINARNSALTMVRVMPMLKGRKKHFNVGTLWLKGILDRLCSWNIFLSSAAANYAETMLSSLEECTAHCYYFYCHYIEFSPTGSIKQVVSLRGFQEAYRQLPFFSMLQNIRRYARKKKKKKGVKLILVSAILCPTREPNLIMRKFPFQRKIPGDSALRLQCNKHSTLHEDHPWTYWIVREGLNGYPTKNPDLESGRPRARHPPQVSGKSNCWFWSQF